MSGALRVRHDFKYSPSDWRGPVAETFQMYAEVKTEYVVVDGQVVRTRETTFAYDSAIAEKTVQVPEVPATFLYIDGTYRKDPVAIFQKTRIRTTTYSAYGDNAYIAAVDDYDVMTGITTHSTSIVDGKIPLAPTIGSALSSIVQQPITGVLEDNCDSIPSTVAVGDAYVEDGEDLAKVAKRRMQRETAIVRRVKHAANPLMKLGQTIRLVDDKRDLDARHILVGRRVTIDEQGGLDEQLELEFWTR